VVVVGGETGCGKSTQIPQLLLEDAIRKKTASTCNIICTQPRRISAVGLAERVAQEQAEKCGETVGYRIRGESNGGAKTRLWYVTCGILLRQLASKDELHDVSHVIIDEVHERSMEIDFLLLIFKQLLPRRPNLKLILMSATLNAALFTAYFNDCPSIAVPGRTFPVTVRFLEDVFEETGHQVQQNVVVCFGVLVSVCIFIVSLHLYRPYHRVYIIELIINPTIYSIIPHCPARRARAKCVAAASNKRRRRRPCVPSGWSKDLIRTAREHLVFLS
jgi:HrpA-like RNA helicase